MRSTPEPADDNRLSLRPTTNLREMKMSPTMRKLSVLLAGTAAFTVLTACAAGATAEVSGASGGGESASPSATQGPADGVDTYESTRYSIDTGQPYESFVTAFEGAVPPFTKDLVAGAANWDEVKANADRAAPNGFFIYAKLNTGEVMKINGVGRDDARSTVYLMGNHTIAETMYQHDPGVMLYAPLRVEIYESETGTAVFSITRPSDQFGSFGNPDITKVGHLLDDKVAHLLTVLGVDVPGGLTS